MSDKNLENAVDAAGESPQAPKESMIIDAHQHFWRLRDRGGYWPPAELAAIYRDFAPTDLAPLLKNNGVCGTVLIQTLPTESDTEYMLGLAKQHAFILGVVGWVALDQPGAAERIERMAINPLVKGLRPMLQDIPDHRWIENPALAPAVKAMIKHRISFDALVLPVHLQPLLNFARQHPELPIVIDHAAKPLIAAGVFEPWFSEMKQLAALPQVHCKLSGLLTEAGTHPDAASVVPYAQALLDLFGPERLLWGSDWPVLRLAGEISDHNDYSGWLAMCKSFLAQLPAEQQAAVLGRNAIRFYRLDDSSPALSVIRNETHGHSSVEISADQLTGNDINAIG